MSRQECQNDNTIDISRQHSFLRNFTHITIPSEIWLRRDLSIQGKALWAELRSLHCKERGGCYASDEYLMEFMQLKRSRLHELYKELKEKGLMEIVSFNGRQTVRRALVPAVEYEETGQQLSAQLDSSYPENRTPTVQETGLPSYIEKKEDIKVSKEPAARESVIFHSFIKMSKEAYEKLVQEHGLQLITRLLQDMETYCLSSGKRYQNYAAAMQTFLKTHKERISKGTYANPKDAIKQRQMEDYLSKNGGFDDNTITF